MGKFEQDAKTLLTAIGGKENVSAVTHCATRMRFVLVDDKKADTKTIENIPSVKGTFTNAGQFQVIIGNDVPLFYNDFTAVSGIEGVSKEAAKSAAKSNQNLIQQTMTLLAEIFTPIIPAIIVGGLILGFRNILEGVQMEWLGRKIVDGVAQTTKDGTPIYNTIVDVSQFWYGVNSFLWLPAQAIFHFLPVGIVWSVTRKMGTSQILGIVLGICLVSPQLLNAYDVANTSASEIAKNWTWDFGFFAIKRIGYQAQVIPALLSGLSLAYLERFWRKVISLSYPSAYPSTHSPWSNRLDNRSMDFNHCSYGTYWFFQMALWCDFRSTLCAICYHWTPSHDNSHRYSASIRHWWDSSLANDCSLKYRTRFSSSCLLLDEPS